MWERKKDKKRIKDKFIFLSFIFFSLSILETTLTFRNSAEGNAQVFYRSKFLKMTDPCDWPRIRVPDACKNVDIVVGIDEAGRGPVLGRQYDFSANLWAPLNMKHRFINILCCILAKV